MTGSFAVRTPVRYPAAEDGHEIPIRYPHQISPSDIPHERPTGCSSDTPAKPWAPDLAHMVRRALLQMSGFQEARPSGIARLGERLEAEHEPDFCKLFPERGAQKGCEHWSLEWLSRFGGNQTMAVHTYSKLQD